MPIGTFSVVPPTQNFKFLISAEVNMKFLKNFLTANITGRLLDSKMHSLNIKVFDMFCFACITIGIMIYSGHGSVAVVS